MKIIDESKGINKSTKESLKSQILNRLLSIDGVSEDDILILELDDDRNITYKRL